ALVLVALEIGLVPAAAGEAERRRGKPAPHRGLAAARTLFRIRVGQPLQTFETMTAFAAVELVDGHALDSRRGSGGRCMAGAALLKAVKHGSWTGAPSNAPVTAGRLPATLFDELAGAAAINPDRAATEAPGLAFHAGCTR